MANGWIKLHRSMQEHWLWNDKDPFDKRSAWIDLLMMANFTDFKVVRNGKLMQRERGEVNTSILYLAERWKWSRPKVKRFLRTLESDGMITTHSTTDGTTVTIEKYDFFQNQGSTDVTTVVPSNVTTDVTAHVTTGVTHDKKTIKKTINNAIKNDISGVEIGQQYIDPVTGRLRMRVR